MPTDTAHLNRYCPCQQTPAMLTDTVHANRHRPCWQTPAILTDTVHDNRHRLRWQTPGILPYDSHGCPQQLWTNTVVAFKTVHSHTDTTVNNVVLEQFQWIPFTWKIYLMMTAMFCAETRCQLLYERHSNKQLCEGEPCSIRYITLSGALH